MPFVDIKCNSITLQKVTGLELATGFAIKGPGSDKTVIGDFERMDDKKVEAHIGEEKNDPNIFMLVALALGVRCLAWVAAARVPPVDLPLREDLRTRLGWGPVFALQSLPEEQARAVLRRESDRRGIFLSDEVMDYLLTRFARDLSHLMAMLDRLDGFALSEHRSVTVPLLKKMLAEQDVA